MALSFANKLTIGRILAVPFFIATVLYYSLERDHLRYVALVTFLIAVISDVVDGYIARTRHQKTVAGAILDPLADKLLLSSAFICLFKMRFLLGEIQLPLWAVVIIISRDVILLLGSMIIYLVNGSLDIVPTKWGKATTFLQVLCVIGILLQWPISFVIWYAAVALTIISGLGYLREGVKVLNDSANQNNP